jgi:uncharacterized protein (TIGR00297 family)
LQGGIGEAFLLNGLLSVAANRARALTVRGAIAMGLMGSWIYVALGWRGYLVPVVFFALGSFFTKLGYEKKRSRHAAQKSEGVRGIREVLANGLVPLAFTIPIGLAHAKLLAHPGLPVASRLFLLGYVAAWATALCDTSSTELGGLWGKRCFLLRNLQAVPPGTEGAVSIEGTVAGFLAAVALVSIAYVMGLVSVRMVLPSSAAALVGSLLESYLAESMSSAHRIRHELLNVFNTSVGSGLALLWAVLFATPR